MEGSMSAPEVASRERWSYLYRVLHSKGPFTDEEAWESGARAQEAVEKAKILGAGGLGCEILKNLALSGFKEIHVIDMDTIDLSNLNRQFLFRESDVGQPKATVAARFVERRVKGVRITPYVGKIQDKDADFYMQFTLVVCGLDSVEARRWINSMLVGMVDEDDPHSMKPLIDGGTEGFKGHARLVFPTISSCLECQLDMHAPRAAVPLCTIATIPRQPEHCIEWALQIAWAEERRTNNFPAFDADDLGHVAWVYQRAVERAQEFGIAGVTFSLAQGVVKNIIPAIASTNAVVAAACTQEALKVVSACAPFLDSYMMYAGEEGVYTYTFAPERKADCPVCGTLARKIQVAPRMTLAEFMALLQARPEAQLKKPSLRTERRTLYQQFPPQLEESTRPNLQKRMDELVVQGEEIAVSDPAFTIAFRYIVLFSKG
ncbi:hypothetical protein KEM52_004638 [Ascosphaera acerosa]|nr:hypothetical protein KEM52_004638 [Ascosphaera acerosa]